MKACHANKSKVHSLTRKSEPLCIHNYLIVKAGLRSEEPTKSDDPVHEVDRRATVCEVMKLIKQNFPTATENPTEFLKVNKEFIERLCKASDINSELLKYRKDQCPICQQKTEKWHHKTKESYLISLGEVKKIQIETQYCKMCKLLIYYDLYSFGCFPVHNKVRDGFHVHKMIKYQDPNGGS